jgi:hypothetical protein
MPITEYSIEKMSLRTGAVSRSLIGGLPFTLRLDTALGTIEERIGLCPGYSYRLVTTERGDWRNDAQKEAEPAEVGKPD